MDTLFRLVTFQKQHHPHHPHPHSFNNSTTTTTTNSSSSRSSTQQTPYHFNYQQPQEQEECFNFFMDEEDYSSSSRHQHNQNQYYSSQQPPYSHQSLSNTPTPTTSTTTTPPPLSHYGFSTSEHQQSSDPNINYSYSPARDVTMEYSNSFTTNTWASDVLLDAARAVADKNSSRLQQLMWMLNELSSPYGDTDQKLSSYFLQALFSRMTDAGDRSYRTLSSASDKMCSFESTRKLVLKFQEVSPWTTFGHVACNGAIMEALEGETKLHIIDVSNTYCTQWPTLLEAIATRTDETPHLRLTTIVVTKQNGDVSGVQKVMREIGTRMEKFARLMGVPFKFNVIHHTGRAIMDLVACSPNESMERREIAPRWSGRFHANGFIPVSYSDEVCDDVRALLRRYREGWSMAPPDTAAGMFLTWKDTPVVWASAWKPI